MAYSICAQRNDTVKKIVPVGPCSHLQKLGMGGVGRGVWNACEGAVIDMLHVGGCT